MREEVSFASKCCSSRTIARLIHKLQSSVAKEGSKSSIPPPSPTHFKRNCHLDKKPSVLLKVQLGNGVRILKAYNFGKCIFLAPGSANESLCSLAGVIKYFQRLQLSCAAALCLSGLIWIGKCVHFLNCASRKQSPFFLLVKPHPFLRVFPLIVRGNLRVT